MNCINCNAPLAAIDYCTNCGADMSILKRINRISNMNYNEGLDKASVRDLSGAINCLKRSLRFNKYNIDARNLLGLVYFETGEVVSALSEWVISKNLQGKDNIADTYITRLQSNANKLSTINQTIKKYNQALSYCHQKSEDMAVIQLKKVLAQNPKLIKGYQLLALLYIRNGEPEKARRVLKKAIRIDNTNTMTLRYIREVDESTGRITQLENRRGRKRDRVAAAQEQEQITYVSGNDTVIQPTKFHDSSIVSTFINIIIGIAIGAAVLWYLVAPAIEQRASKETNEAIKDFSNQLSQQTAKVKTLEKELQEYVDRMEEADKKMEDADTKAASYEEIIQAAAAYLGTDPEEELDEKAAAAIVQNINEEALEGDARVLYDSLVERINETLAKQYCDQGLIEYVQNQNYEAAIELLEKCIELDPENEQALEHLAFSYKYTSNVKKSNETFTKLYDLTQNPKWQGHIVNDAGSADDNQGNAQGDNNEPNDGDPNDGDPNDGDPNAGDPDDNNQPEQ